MDTPGMMAPSFEGLKVFTGVATLMGSAFVYFVTTAGLSALQLLAVCGLMSGALWMPYLMAMIILNGSNPIEVCGPRLGVSGRICVGWVGCKLGCVCGDGGEAARPHPSCSRCHQSCTPTSSSPGWTLPRQGLYLKLAYKPLPAELPPWVKRAMVSGTRTTPDGGCGFGNAR
jgi:hypothetical protein